MTSIDDIERRKYEAIWTHRDYRQSSPGEKGVAFAIEQMGWKPPAYIVDLGCGTGRASMRLAEAGFSVNAIDIAANALDDAVTADPRVRFFNQSLTDPALASFKQSEGYCTDVMEHIPPEQIDQVLANIAANIERVFFGIAHFPDVWHGETLHLTVEPPEWWADKLAEHFDTGVRLDGFNIRRADMNSYWRCENGTP